MTDVHKTGGDKTGEDRPRPLTYAGHHGIDLVGDVRGDRADPTVLLLHGGGQTRHSWGGTAETLARRGWCAITIDARGHGESDWHAEGDYSLTAFALDVREVARSLPTAPFVVGASLGGCTAMLLEGELAPGTNVPSCSSTSCRSTTRWAPIASIAS